MYNLQLQTVKSSPTHRTRIMKRAVKGRFGNGEDHPRTIVLTLEQLQIDFNGTMIVANGRMENVFLKVKQT